jgi:hypothetical protein
MISFPPSFCKPYYALLCKEDGPVGNLPAIPALPEAGKSQV